MGQQLRQQSIASGLGTVLLPDESAARRGPAGARSRQRPGTALHGCQHQAGE